MYALTDTCRPFMNNFRIIKWKKLGRVTKKVYICTPQNGRWLWGSKDLREFIVTEILFICYDLEINFKNKLK